jgi:hypothetical protein
MGLVLLAEILFLAAGWRANRCAPAGAALRAARA